MDQGLPDFQQNPPLQQGYPPQQDPYGGGYGAAAPMDTQSDRMVELIEAMINEKWTDFTENMNRVIDWKEKTDARITELDTKMKDLRADYDKLHGAILEKVGQYDQNIHNVGIEIKALEKVFQKILPTLTENVNELSRITRAFKRKEEGVAPRPPGHGHH